MNLKVVCVVLSATAWLACSAGVATTSTNGGPAGSGSAGDPSLCSTVESKLEARCGAPKDPQTTARGVETCKTSASDSKCGRLYTALLQCADVELAQRGLCPGDEAPSGLCTAEVTAWADCTKPASSGGADASTPTDPGTCTAESICSNGACTCATGPHKGEPCCDRGDQTCTTRPVCDSLCKICN